MKRWRLHEPGSAGAGEDDTWHVGEGLLSALVDGLPGFHGQFLGRMWVKHGKTMPLLAHQHLDGWNSSLKHVDD